MIRLGINPCHRFVLQHHGALDAVISKPSAQPIHSFVNLLPFLPQLFICKKIKLNGAIADSQVGYLDTEGTDRLLPVVICTRIAVWRSQ